MLAPSQLRRAGLGLHVSTAMPHSSTSSCLSANDPVVLTLLRRRCTLTSGCPAPSSCTLMRSSRAQPTGVCCVVLCCAPGHMLAVCRQIDGGGHNGIGEQQQLHSCAACSSCTPQLFARGVLPLQRLSCLQCPAAVCQPAAAAPWGAVLPPARCKQPTALNTQACCQHQQGAEQPPQGQQ